MLRNGFARRCAPAVSRPGSTRVSFAAGMRGTDPSASTSTTAPCSFRSSPSGHTSGSRVTSVANGGWRSSGPVTWLRTKRFSFRSSSTVRPSKTRLSRRNSASCSGHACPEGRPHRPLLSVCSAYCRARSRKRPERPRPSGTTPRHRHGRSASHPWQSPGRSGWLCSSCLAFSGSSGCGERGRAFRVSRLPCCRSRTRAAMRRSSTSRTESPRI